MLHPPTAYSFSTPWLPHPLRSLLRDGPADRRPAPTSADHGSPAAERDVARARRDRETWRGRGSLCRGPCRASRRLLQSPAARARSLGCSWRVPRGRWVGWTSQLRTVRNSAVFQRNIQNCFWKITLLTESFRFGRKPVPMGSSDVTKKPPKGRH